MFKIWDPLLYTTVISPMERRALLLSVGTSLYPLWQILWLSVIGQFTALALLGVRGVRGCCLPAVPFHPHGPPFARCACGAALRTLAWHGMACVLLLLRACLLCRAAPAFACRFAAALLRGALFLCAFAFCNMRTLRGICRCCMHLVFVAYLLLCALLPFYAVHVPCVLCIFAFFVCALRLCFALLRLCMALSFFLRFAHALHLHAAYAAHFLCIYAYLCIYARLSCARTAYVLLHLSQTPARPRGGAG